MTHGNLLIASIEKQLTNLIPFIKWSFNSIHGIS